MLTMLDTLQQIVDGKEGLTIRTKLISSATTYIFTDFSLITLAIFLEHM
jgi:hypothetical protein